MRSDYSPRAGEQASSLLLEGLDLGGRLRPMIAASWQRSVVCGVQQEKKSDLPYDTDYDGDSRLLRAARPVLDRLITTLADTPTSVILADEEARILQRWVGDGSLHGAMDKADAAPGFVFAEEFAGTNGVGTVFEESSIVEVRGEEHYADFLRHLACVGVPIHHPLTRKIQGVLDITCLERDHNPLMAPLLVEAVRHIETRLTQMAAPHEVALLEEFLRTCRRYPGATVAVNPGMILTNPAAAEHLVPFDHPVLWDFAMHLLRSGRQEGVVELARGSCLVCCTPVDGGSKEPRGVVIRLAFSAPKAHRVRPAGGTAGQAPAKSLPGRSPQWRQVMSQIRSLALTKASVAIIGEPGVGKLRLARHLHELTVEAGTATPLRVLDASITPDEARTRLPQTVRTALDDGATVVLRRINCLPHEVVAGLHSVVDADPAGSAARPGRLIVTMSSSSESDDSSGQLTHFPHEVWVPPLNHRSEDIADLVPALLAEDAQHKPPRCSLPALQVLLRCRWPGNVTELKEALTAALTASEGREIQPQHLPEWVLRRSSQRQLSTLEICERNAIIHTLISVDNNRTEAAKILGIGRATLYRKMRSLGIPAGQELAR